MLNRKSDDSDGKSSVIESEELKQDLNKRANMSKSSNLLVSSDSESGSEDESEGGGALLDDESFKINEEYAKRFEHNKKREELHRLEEKFKQPTKPSKGQYGDKYDDDEDSSSDESEDDEGFLATEDLDAQISATLQAIRNKDPRVYDEKVTFYAPIEDEDDGTVASQKEKPMYLRDYHRENLLTGHTDAEETEDVSRPQTFAEEQDDFKRTIVEEMHAAAEDDGSSSESGEDEERKFLVPKVKSQLLSQGIPSRTSKADVDVTIADRDPETFLSNFMSARAWVPTDGARFQPFESDDDDEEERAERFETAYNLRFEDPQGSNEVLKSYARDIVAAKSVRREEPNSRKRKRDAEQERRDEERKEREEERARLRKLKIEEMEGKLQKIKEAAGLRGKTLKDEEWVKFLDEGWDDDTWEAEMKKRFGDEYYADRESGSEEQSSNEETNGQSDKKNKKKLKKPEWEDDIDITDIIPEFEKEESSKEPAFTLSDSGSDQEDEETEATSGKAKSSKDRQQEKLAKRKAARIQRKKIEELVDNHLDAENAVLSVKSKQPLRFRYRETSPTSFGLTARDILMAPDAALNEFAGLKKMASFRDAEKKRKDKRRLGKKARLREWRRETFGNENGPENVIGQTTSETIIASNSVQVIEGDRKKRKRSKKSEIPT